MNFVKLNVSVACLIVLLSSTANAQVLCPSLLPACNQPCPAYCLPSVQCQSCNGSLTYLCPQVSNVLATPLDRKCPTAKIAQIPMGAGTLLCLWEVSDCTVDPVVSVGTMFSSCTGSVCSCVSRQCQPPFGTPALLPSVDVVVEDEILTSVAPTSVELREKRLTSNRRTLTVTTPQPGNMVPPNAGDIMSGLGWDSGLLPVKYLSCVRLQFAANDFENFAIYKIFKQSTTNQDGSIDDPDDIYVGVKISELPTDPPGGVLQIQANSGDVRLLPKNQANRLMEVAVRIAVDQVSPSGTQGTTQKWFHLFGLYR